MKLVKESLLQCYHLYLKLIHFIFQVFFLFFLKFYDKEISHKCWEKRVIFPLKQNPNRATRQIILNKHSGIIKEIKRKKHTRKLLTEFGQFSLISEQSKNTLLLLLWEKILQIEIFNSEGGEFNL